MSACLYRTQRASDMSDVLAIRNIDIAFGSLQHSPSANYCHPCKMSLNPLQPKKYTKYLYKYTKEYICANGTDMAHCAKKLSSSVRREE